MGATLVTTLTVEELVDVLAPRLAERLGEELARRAAGAGLGGRPLPGEPAPAGSTSTAGAATGRSPKVGRGADGVRRRAATRATASHLQKTEANEAGAAGEPVPGLPPVLKI